MVHGGWDPGHGASGRQRARRFRTLNLRFAHWKTSRQRHLHRAGARPVAQTLRGVANLGVRPSLDPNDVNGGRVLLETHCLDWPDCLGAEGPTVKSSAWNCCTNCTTSSNTTAWTP